MKLFLIISIVFARNLKSEIHLNSSGNSNFTANSTQANTTIVHVVTANHNEPTLKKSESANFVVF
jgi:hypothetical protein